MRVAVRARAPFLLYTYKPITNTRDGRKVLLQHRLGLVATPTSGLVATLNVENK